MDTPASTATTEEVRVIELTRLNGSRLYVNAEHIRYAEANPDTVVTFVDGSRIVVRETPAELADKVVAYKGSIMSIACRQPAEG
jgi:flagellar protein FlbD